MSKKHITLEYDHGNPDYTPGQWTAAADNDGSPEYDAAGATPLEALWNLARVLYEEVL